MILGKHEIMSAKALSVGLGLNERVPVYRFGNMITPILPAEDYSPGIHTDVHVGTLF